MSVSELARQEEEQEYRPALPAPRRLVLVNGPPSSGKDTVGELLKEFYPGTVYLTKMAKALKERTHALYGMGTLAHDTFESMKDEPASSFMGITPRQAYINVSEMLMKPVHGSGIWGKLLVEDIERNAEGADLVVVTDSGFASEAAPVMREMGVENITLLRIRRDGTSFEGDSRSYIMLGGILAWDVYNNGSKFELATALADALGFEIDYRVEVQLPAGPFALNWFQQGKARPSTEQALAAVEALRQGGYGQRAIRVVAGRDTVVKIVMPGDAPATELM